jgi:hypothetical protein
MPYITEVLSIGGNFYDDITSAIRPLNASQAEFQFAIPPNRLLEEGFTLVRRSYLSAEIYDFLREYRNKAKGHRPFLIGVMNSALRSEKYWNLFGSHEAEEGLAVFTLHNHERFVESRRAFISYYLIRYSLSFVAPKLKSHKDTKACFYDFKENKNDLKESLATGELCDDCRKLLQDHFTPEIHKAFQSMVTVMQSALSAQEPAENGPISILTIPAQNIPDAGATPQVVILVHGIRDFALWQEAIRATLKVHGFIVNPTNYGRFDLIRFLIPIPFFRKRKVNEVVEQIRIIKHENPNSDISVIAHSFGTYIIAHILEANTDLTLRRMIFCGSVLSYRFRFQRIRNQFEVPILNEVGTRDIWPAMAESITWGYGSAGTYGFRRPLVHDRWHNKAGHGYFLKPQFVEKYWLPFLEHGTIISDNPTPESPPFPIELLYVFRLKYVVLFLCLLIWVLVHFGLI